MKRTTLLLIILIVSGCKEYNKADLLGGWQTMIGDQYCELWFEGDIVLDWNYTLGEIRLRNYEIKNNTIYFSKQYLENESPQGIAFSMDIKSISNGSIILIDNIHPDQPRHTYSSIDSEKPKFSIEIIGTFKQRELEIELLRSSEKRMHVIQE